MNPNELTSMRSTVMNGVETPHSRISLHTQKANNSESGYNQLVSLFSNYSVPLFFSEYGCNLVEPRLFTEVGSICTPSRFSYSQIDSTDMISVFSGGLVYEWTEEVSNYGLVELSNGNITLLPDYKNLKAEFAKTPMPSGDGGYKPSGSASTCPANSTDFTSWKVLPAIPARAEVYIESGAGQPLGYNGPTNQGAGATVSSLSRSTLTI